MAQQLVEAAPDNTLFSDWLLEPWLRWDANWYTDIAIHGFQQPHATAYAPLYPFLIRLLGGVLSGRYLLAALIISNGCVILGFWLLHRLVALDHSLETANHVLLVMALFPTSFFLIAPYTEALFLTLVMGALLCGRRRHWACAALLATLASITRWQGVGLAPALAWTYLEQVRDGCAWQDWRQWALHPWQQWVEGLWLAVIPLGIGVILHWYTSLNAKLPVEEVNQFWNLTRNWPWVGLLRTPLAWFDVYDVPNAYLIPLVTDWVSAMLILALSVAALRRIRGDLLILGWFILLSSLSFLYGDVFLHSVSRYMLMVLPAFVMLGIITQHRPRLLRGYIIAGMLFGLFFSAFYLNWLFLA